MSSNNNNKLNIINNPQTALVKINNNKVNIYLNNQRFKFRMKIRQNKGKKIKAKEACFL